MLDSNNLWIKMTECERWVRNGVYESIISMETDINGLEKLQLQKNSVNKNLLKDGLETDINGLEKLQLQTIKICS